MSHSCFYPRLIALILIFLKSGLLFVRAQQPNEWPLIWDNIRLNFECNQKSDFTVSKENSKFLGFGGLWSPLYFINDTNGEIKYFISEDSCHNKSHQFLKNSNFSNHEKYKYDWQFESNYYFAILKIAACRIPNAQGKYYIFNQISTDYKILDTLKQNMRIVYRVLEDSIDNGMGGFRDKGTTYLSNTPLFFQNIVPFNNNKGYWLIAKGLNKYYVYKIDENGINIHDSIINNEKFRGYRDCIMSPMGTRLLSFNLSNNYQCLFEPNIKNTEITVYDFDKIIGKLSYHKKIDFTLLYKSLSTANYAFPVSFSFSPNDSLLYVNSYDGRLNAANRSFISQMYVNDNSRFYFIDSTGDQDYYTGYIGIVSNSGKLFFTSRRRGLPSPHIVFGCINKPNNFGKSCEYDSNIKKYYSTYDLITEPYSVSYSNGTYKPLYLDYKKGCKGFVTLYSMLDSFYTKAILNLDGKDIYISKQNKDSILVNLLPGKHYVRLTAMSGKNPDVCLYDSLTIEPPPIASFTTIDTIGCQWLGFKFNDMSQSAVNTSSYFSKWNFGDGTDTLISGKTLPLKSPTHIYTKEGNYKVQLIFDNGKCRDTFTQLKKVNILAAPQPGFNYNPIKACSPEIITFTNLNNGVVDSTHWDFGSGKFFTTKTSQVKSIYNKSGDFIITQTLYGPTGCITSANKTLKLIQGLDSTIHPELISASISSDDIQYPIVQWKPLNEAARYELFRNNQFISTSGDTFYYDVQSNGSLASYEYKVKVMDQCQRFSGLSNSGKTILLKGKSYDNKNCILEWTSYEKWNSGVKNYKVQTYNNDIKEWNNLAELEDDSRTYEDPNFIKPGQIESCYRITAVNDERKGEISISNNICLAYFPVLFIPNSFTPNGDGLNDKFLPSMAGIVSYDMKIFSRWGQLIYSGSCPWNGTVDGKPAEGEVYMYTLQIIRNDRINEFHRGMVHLIR